MDHRIALSQVIIQLVQGFHACRDEVLLHHGNDVGAFKVMSQSITVTAKLSTDGGQEDANLCHGCFSRANDSFVVVLACEF